MFNNKVGIAIITSSLVLTGVGCNLQAVSDLSPEEAAMSLSFNSGSEIILRPTVFGVGGQIVGWLGGETDDTAVTINSWTAGSSVGLNWSITTQVETDESKAARAAWSAEYEETPIGVDIPDEPDAVYVDEVMSGAISSVLLAEGTTIMIPSLWPEGDAGQQETNLIWLSTNQYNELSSTRSTTMSLGLFDESLQQAEDLTEQVQGYVEQLTSLLPDLFPESDEGTDTEVDDTTLTTITADGDWGEYTLDVDGVRTTVRTIKAKNSFGTYTFLANIDNPILLEIVLTPLAQGSLKALSPSGLVDGFSGYEVTTISLQ